MAMPTPKPKPSLQQRIEQRQKWMKRVRYGVFLPGLLVGALTGIGALIWPSVTHVETGKSSQYVDIQPQFLDASADEIVRSVQEIVDATPRIHAETPLTAEEPRTELRLEAKGPGLPMTTNIVITIQESRPGESIIHMRASGGTGKTDFGRYARNIRFLQREIDRRTRDDAPAP